MTLFQAAWASPLGVPAGKHVACSRADTPRAVQGHAPPFRGGRPPALRTVSGAICARGRSKPQGTPVDGRADATPMFRNISLGKTKSRTNTEHGGYVGNTTHGAPLPQ